ncbi:MAG: hypothetical protein RML75_06870, partial [Cyanobacteriota bacterium SKYGB_h_bin112]|nr:hypothetical protein [Cyanobacteriota bacterium SKYGB_h_bin112]
MTTTASTQRRLPDACSIGLAFVGAVTAPSIAQAAVPGQPATSVNPVARDVAARPDIGPTAAIAAITDPEPESSVA